ncbi:MAG: thiamine phosphate synthase [Rhodanobacteraceae bacterium]
MPPSPPPARPHLPPRGLYAVTDGPRDDLVEAARAALEGGAVILQYRDKSRDRARRLREAQALVELCRGFDVPLIVNDDVELAGASGAAGVHVGEDDADITAARVRLGPGALIGVSCYDSLARAHDASRAGADYLAFGSPFASSTKPSAHGAPASILGEARTLGRPIVVIGGITAENGGSLIAAGADFLAVVSGVFSAPDVRGAARCYAELFDTDKSGSNRIRQ